LYAKAIQLKKYIGSGTFLYLSQIDEMKQLVNVLRSTVHEADFSDKYFETAEYMALYLDE